jgi:hypothetical protein
MGVSGFGENQKEGLMSKKLGATGAGHCHFSVLIVHLEVLIFSSVSSQIGLSTPDNDDV